METLAFLAVLTVIGWIAVHLLNRSREREAREHSRKMERDNRKRDFLGFMDKFRTKIERGAPSQVAKEFTADCALFRQEATKIRDDCPAQFWVLVDRLSGLRDSDVEDVSRDGKMIGRERLITAVDAVVNFVRAN